jgi:hypothetical protein
MNEAASRLRRVSYPPFGIEIIVRNSFSCAGKFLWRRATRRLADYGNWRLIRPSKLSDDKFLVADYLVNGRYPNACIEKVYKISLPLPCSISAASIE